MNPEMLCTTAPHPVSFFALLRVETKKSRHGAPLRLAVLLALPFPLLALGIAMFIPPLGLQFFLWDYWYTLLFSAALVLLSVVTARLDSRLGHRALLSLGTPRWRLWLAKYCRCWFLAAVFNLIVFAIYTLGALLVPGESARILSILAAALAIAVLSSWIIPVAIFLTAWLGALAGVFVPLIIQLVLGFAWFAVPFWPLLPPIATVVVPTSFLLVLPSAEPASVDPALMASLTGGGWVALALVCAIVWGVALTVLGLRWFACSEELR